MPPSSPHLVYHRQFADGPTIFIRNGFLDHGFADDESHAAADAWPQSFSETQDRLRRAKSAPTLIDDKEKPNQDEVATDAGSDRPSTRCGASFTAPSSPWIQVGLADAASPGRAPGASDLVSIMDTVEFTLEEAEMDGTEMWCVGGDAVGLSPQLSSLLAQMPSQGHWMGGYAQPMQPVAFQGSPILSAQPSPTLSAQASPMLSAQASPQLTSPQMSPQLSPQLAPQISQECLAQLAPQLSQLPSAEEDSWVDLGGFGVVPPQPHTIAKAVSNVSGMYRIHWTVDAGKLHGHERQAVSPSFDLPMGGHTSNFRLIIVPKSSSDVKGSASFKKAGGRGCVQLKCEAPRGVVSFWISTTNGRDDYLRKPRGPIAHDFAWHSTCGLPRDQEQWDFGKAVDKSSQTFTVCVDILPHVDL